MKKGEEKHNAPVSVPDDVRKKVSERMMAESEEGRITCARAQGLAKTLGVPYAVVGQLADELGIRVKECQLGCF